MTYDDNGLVSEIRILNGSATETYRYTYEDGNVSGLTFAPAIPLGDQFDLRGKSYAKLALMHIAPPIEADIPHVSGGGGGDGGGSGDGSGGGSGGTCWEGDGTACDTCLQNNCCSQGQACDAGSPCQDFYNCASPCNGDSTCISSCQSQFSQGASAYNAFITCDQSFCSSSCQ